MDGAPSRLAIELCTQSVQVEALDMIAARVPCREILGHCLGGTGVAVGDCHAGLEQTLLLENVLGFAAGGRIFVAGVGRRNGLTRSRLGRSRWPYGSQPVRKRFNVPNRTALVAIALVSGILTADQ